MKIFYFEGMTLIMQKACDNILFIIHKLQMSTSSEIVSFLFRNFCQILFGCAAQYTIMPTSGVIVSKFLGLPPALSVGLILLSCCPGGTASNVVRLYLSTLFLFSIDIYSEFCWNHFWPSLFNSKQWMFSFLIDGTILSLFRQLIQLGWCQ